MTQAAIVLASRSPRRRELLDQMGVTYRIVDVDVDESHLPNESAQDYVARLARVKAQAGSESLATVLPPIDDTTTIVLGADTIVVLDTDVGEKLLGKPKDREDGLAILRQLSAATHRVLTAVCATNGSRCETVVSETRVSFRQLQEAEIVAYWQSGEPADKAGAYGIQGLAAAFIARIEGSYSGVMGLPLCETATLLQGFGIQVLTRSSE